MTEEVDETKNADHIRFFGIILPSLPYLMLRFGGLFLRFKREAKKGGRIFQKELINQGLDKTTAAGLTEIYLEGSSLKQYLKLFS